MREYYFLVILLETIVALFWCLLHLKRQRLAKQSAWVVEQYLQLKNMGAIVVNIGFWKNAAMLPQFPEFNRRCRLVWE
ncbi:hypothetical protein [Microvirga vignae]|nr:hypothetical protein [Microvirga vignae]